MCMTKPQVLWFQTSYWGWMWGPQSFWSQNACSTKSPQCLVLWWSVARTYVTPSSLLFHLSGASNADHQFITNEFVLSFIQLQLIQGFYAWKFRATLDTFVFCGWVVWSTDNSIISTLCRMLTNANIFRSLSWDFVGKWYIFIVSDFHSISMERIYHLCFMNISFTINTWQYEDVESIKVCATVSACLRLWQENFQCLMLLSCLSKQSSSEQHVWKRSL